MASFKQMSKLLNRPTIIAVLFFGSCLETYAHNVGNAITWNREISRIIYQRCASCHRKGGTSFSLTKYEEVQPRAAEIKREVLARRMPPWGAVKGFGSFRDDKGLTQVELDLISDWVDSDTPKGNNPNVLPKEPKFPKSSTFKSPKNGIAVSGSFTLGQALTLNGLLPVKVPHAASFKIVATLPNGKIQPLLWLYEYKDTYQHPFLFAKPLDLPAGTIISGLPQDASMILIPGRNTKPSK
jgi:hypothetical protein